MTKPHDFLLEIGTEELPAKGLATLIESLSANIATELQKYYLSYGEIISFATPRRLAVLIKALAVQQPSHAVERKGPMLATAFDHDKKPTKAAEGFARSCGVAVDQLQIKEEEQGIWLVYRYEQKGRLTSELLPEIMNNAINALPIAKPMRWNNLTTTFIRPAHWIVMLLDDHIVPGEILGISAGNASRGHRFHHPQALTIKHAAEYSEILYKQGLVIAEIQQRRDAICSQIAKITQQNGGEVAIDETLLAEVTGLVEWPVVLLAHFADRFLAIPKEAVICALKTHQKSFPVINTDGVLLPYFVTVSNIESKDPDVVIKGNERVVHARLADAEFFYQTDCKKTLEQHLENLKGVVFQEKLGSLYDKSQRLSLLASAIANELGVSKQHAARAGQLAKADLVTAMVGEFPELQGIMGYHYALHDGEPESVAIALREQYLPRFAGDVLPETSIGCALALAERLDTLVGIFSIQQQPTGDKDPFGLRRAALGILRILIQKQLPLDLQSLLEKTAQAYQIKSTNDKVVAEVFDFIIERLRAWYQEQHVTAEVFSAVLAKRPTVPVDFDRRIKAVSEFCRLSQAKKLIAANKRVRNILIKEEQQHIAGDIDPTLFECEVERELFDSLIAKDQAIAPHLKKADYTEALIELASLQQPVDKFFDNVMVMVDNKSVRENRLRLLNTLRDLFLKMADISLLQ